MKCAKCGAELKKGCLYCSVCGHEAQIVSDYNVLEDDYLRSLLKDGEGEKNPQEKEPEPKKTKKTGDAYVLQSPHFVCKDAFAFYISFIPTRRPSTRVHSATTTQSVPTRW